MFNSYTETTLRYDAELCINCDMCNIVCPHAVFTRGEKVAVLANPLACMECGACMVNCPVMAIYVDAGVGCASAMINAALRGKKMEECSCGGDDCCG
jgi:ferredoxin